MNPIAKVQTWGTHHGSRYGIRNYLNAAWRRENPGHASIELQVPVTDENKRLIDRYCSNMPHQEKAIINDSGEQEKMYTVRFSFTPGSSGDPFYLIPTYSGDCEYERTGHHTTDRHSSDVANFPIRRSGKRDITVYQKSTLTPQGKALNFGEAKGKCILNIHAMRNLDDKLKVVAVLKEKLKSHKKSKGWTLDKTIINCAKTLDIDISGGAVNSASLSKSLATTILSLNNEKKQYIEETQKLVLQLEERFRISISSELETYKIRENLTNFEIFDTVLSDLKKLSETRNITNITSELLKNGVAPILERLESLQTFDATYGYDIVPFLQDLLKQLDETEFTADEINNEINNEIKPAILQRIEYREPIFYKDWHDEINKCNKLQSESDSVLDTFLCSGRPPDSEVILPISQGSNAETPKKGALKLESMLQQMEIIANSSHPYSFEKNNCSIVAMSILDAGITGKQKDDVRSVFYKTTTPQMVHNRATDIRNSYCKQDTTESLANLNTCFAKYQIKPKQPNNATLREAIQEFAANTIFPDAADIKERRFFTFPKSMHQELHVQKNHVVSTELLHDLWNIIPGKNLPLTKDGSVFIQVDQNLLIGDLMQGLSVLAEMNIEKLAEVPTPQATINRFKQAIDDVVQSTSQSVSEPASENHAFKN